MTRIVLCLCVVGWAIPAHGQDGHPWTSVPLVEPTRFGPLPLRFAGTATGVLVSPDGRWLVGRSYSEFRAWSLATGCPLLPETERYYASNAVFAPDSRSLLATVNNQPLVVIDLATGDSRPVFETDPVDRSVIASASRDGRRIVFSTGSSRGNYESRTRNRSTETWYAVRDTTTKGYLGRVFDPDDAIRTVSLSPDGKWLASAGGSGTIKLWDATTGKMWRTLRDAVPPSSTSRRNVTQSYQLTFSPDGMFLAAAGGTGSPVLPLTLWSVPDGTRLMWWDAATGGPSVPFAFAPDGRTLFAAGFRETGGVSAFELATGAKGRVYRGHGGGVRSIALTPDGREMVTTGDDGTIRVWNVATGAERFPHYGHLGDVDHLAYGPGGHWFASGGADGTVRVRNPVTGAEWTAPLYPSHGASVSALAADFAGTRLAVGYSTGVIRIWDWATNDLREMAPAEGAQSPPTQLRFDPDGRGLSAGTSHGTLARWSLPAGTPIPVRPPTTDDESPDHLHIGPDPFALGVVQRNNTIRFVIRDLATGRVRVEKTFSDRERISSPGVTPDGKWVTGTPDWSDGLRVVQFRDTDTLALRFHLPVVDLGDRPQNRYTPDGRFALFADNEGKACAVELASGGLVARLESEDLSVSNIALAPDASRAVGVRSDGLFGTFELRRPSGGILSDADREKCWADLLAHDPKVALPAVDRLAADPDRSVPFLRERLRPAEPLAGDEWKKLLAGLDAPRYADRNASAARLTEVADRHTDDLANVLKGVSSPEARKAVERILRDTTEANYRPRGEALRHVRAVYALEWAGTKEAAELLRALAATPGGTVLRSEAATAARRVRW